MKKYFLSIVALAGMLFATSCQESLVEPQVGGTTTFTVQVPDQMGTKAIGDASIIDRLYVAVYEDFDENGGTLPTSAIYKVNVPVSGGTATVELNLIQGHKYDIVFWAQNGTSYVDENSELLSIPMTNTFHNNENGAAFFHFERNFEPKGYAKGITLRRPFAQLNLGTTKESLKTNLGDVTLSKSTVVVSSVATSFNTVTGEGVADQVTEGTYVAPIAFDQTLTVAGKEYVYVSMDYLPVAVDNGQDKATVDIRATIETNKGNIVHNFTSVPIKENYRTNIVGNLISSSTDFNVIVDAKFDGELPKSGKEQLQFVAANGGEVILQENVVLDEPLVITAGTKATLVPVVIDLNGHIIFQVKSQTGAYSMIDNRGNLTIKDSQGTGCVLYSDEGNGGEYVSNTIANSGVLVIEGGNFNNNSLTNNGYPHVIDNSGRLVINGGTFTNTANYSTMRIWCTTDDDTEVIINGGTFNGSIDFQTVSQAPNKGILTINGGTFNADAFTLSAVRLLGFGVDVDEMICNISGGTFNGLVKLNNFVGVGNEFNSQVFYISGGTFANDPSVFVVDGYVALKGTNDYYEVLPSAEADVYVASAEDLANAVNNATDDITIAIVDDIEEGHISLTQKAGIDVTILGNDHTYTGTLHIWGNGASDDRSMTIKNINFVFNPKAGIKPGDQGCIYTTGAVDGRNSYACNVTIENCTFTNTEGVEAGAAIRQNVAGEKDWTIKNCTVSANMHSLLQVSNTNKGDGSGLLVEGCKVYSKNGANLNYTCYATFVNCEFDVRGYAVRVGVDGNDGNPNDTKEFNFNTCTFKSENKDGDAVIIIRQDAQKATLNFEETTLVGNPKISGIVEGVTKINGTY